MELKIFKELNAIGRRMRRSLRVFWHRRVLGAKRGSTTDSNQRRGWIRIGLFIALCIFCASWFAPSIGSTYRIFVWLAGFWALAVSFFIFFVVVLLMPFKDREGFKVNPSRLLLDTAVSALMMISSFSLVYQGLGIYSSIDQCLTHSPAEAVYFSMVTFSTLGYGDFSPPTNLLRFLAALEALMGNVHLGMAVGSTFAAIKSRD